MGLEIIPTPFRATLTSMDNPQLWNLRVSASHPLMGAADFALRKMFVLLTCHLCAANITGLGSWGNSLARAQAMVSNMTLDEKVGIVPRLTYLHTSSRLLLRADQLDSRINE